jgi:hypothetical protein
MEEKTALTYHLYKASYGHTWYDFPFTAYSIDEAMQKAKLIYEQAGLIGRCYVQTNGIVIDSIQ